jgi:hypothetical protein
VGDDFLSRQAYNLIGVVINMNWDSLIFQSYIDELMVFLNFMPKCRFTRNANLVALGVARNMRRVGNSIKETFEDIVYPYRKPPK